MLVTIELVTQVYFADVVRVAVLLDPAHHLLYDVLLEVRVEQRLVTDEQGAVGGAGRPNNARTLDQDGNVAEEVGCFQHTKRAEDFFGFEIPLCEAYVRRPLSDVLNVKAAVGAHFARKKKIEVRALISNLINAFAFLAVANLQLGA